MNKTLVTALACAAAGALAAAPIERGMGLNGDVRVGDGARMLYEVVSE